MVEKRKKNHHKKNVSLHNNICDTAFDQKSYQPAEVGDLQWLDRQTDRQTHTQTDIWTL